MRSVVSVRSPTRVTHCCGRHRQRCLDRYCTTATEGAFCSTLIFALGANNLNKPARKRGQQKPGRSRTLDHGRNTDFAVIVR